MTEAILSNLALNDAISGNPKIQQDGTYSYTALFWHSPFAMAAGVVVTTQLMLYSLAFATSQAPNLITTLPFILIATMMLTVGTMPIWNCLKLNDEGLEQHAGLTKLTRHWSEIQRINVFQHWIEIHYLEDTNSDKAVIKIDRILNRYGIPSDELGKHIEEKWQNARGLSL